jgi:selenocysteine lyase/cysteine desulfurase
VRLISARERRPLRILASDGEFHSFRRQAQRFVESRRIKLDTVPLEPHGDFTERFLAVARAGKYDLVFISHVFFKTGLVFAPLAELAALAAPETTWLAIDGYHGFMALPTDLSTFADRAFYIAGGYKYAMSGEGAAFIHAPPGFAERPEITGWYAEFADLEATPGQVGYARDGARFWGATFDPSGLYRFNAVRAMLAREGLDTAATCEHVAPLLQLLADGISQGQAGPLAEAELLNRSRAGRPGARFLALKHKNAASWRAQLLARDIVADARDDVLRLGLGLYHDPEDIERFCAAAADLRTT